MVGSAVGGMLVWVGIADRVGDKVAAMVGSRPVEVVGVACLAGVGRRVVASTRQEAARTAAMTKPAIRARTRAEMGNAISR
jgi:kynureninase